MSVITPKSQTLWVYIYMRPLSVRKRLNLKQNI
ncbi:hypothetical protein MNBD_GAMMA16-2306, partial [hydrothermal vent metagenome]